MIPLQNKQNTGSPTSDFPYGDLNDDDGTSNGTPANRELFTDIMQLAEKIMDESGVIPNGVPDNEYSGWQLFEALKKVTQSSYKLYSIHITQSGASIPVVDVCKDDFGGVTWSYQGAGIYRGTADTPGAFTGIKRGVLISPPTNGTTTFSVSITDDFITVNTFDVDYSAGTSTLSDSLLIQGYIELKVWE